MNNKIINSIDVVVPVLNEERVLAESVAKLRDFLGENLSCRWQIVIADNGSVDGTLDVARSLSEQYPDVTYVTLEL